jgi:hypothetical protein
MLAFDIMRIPMSRVYRYDLAQDSEMISPTIPI